MEEFIDKQIMSFNKKKYNLLSKHIEILNKYPFLVFVIIKNNNIYEIKYKKTKIRQIYDREKKINDIFTFFLQKYNIQDTHLFINMSDCFFWREDIPVFNWVLPDGLQGLIFPDFDILNSFIDDDKEYNFDEAIQKCINYEPSKINNEIFFIGQPTSFFRKNLNKISENPLKIIIFEKTKYNLNIIKFNKKVQYNYMQMPEYKNYKYLFDLPGYRPWSVRLKYLFFMDRYIIRISFYNSLWNETSYWKHWFDYLFDENDYSHLIYDDLEYGEKLDDKMMSKIKNDILEIYNDLEKHPEKYKKAIDNIKQKRKELNLDNTMKYLYTLISRYTDEILDQ